MEVLRVPVFDTQAIRRITKARNGYLAKKLMKQQSRRVTVECMSFESLDYVSDANL